jgi:hypothetical protein
LRNEPPSLFGSDLDSSVPFGRRSRWADGAPTMVVALFALPALAALINNAPRPPLVLLRSAVSSTQMSLNFWQAKAAKAHAILEIQEAALDELQEREALLLAQLRAEDERARTQLEAQRQQQLSAVLPAPAASVTTARVKMLEQEVDELVAAQSELVALLEAQTDASNAQLADAERTREIDLQRTAAFWVDRVSRAQAAASAEPAMARAPAAASAAVALEARVASLEEQLSASEQSEAAGLLALQSQALQAETELQRTAAFWIAKLEAVKAEAAAATQQARAVASAQQSLAELRTRESLGVLPSAVTGTPEHGEFKANVATQEETASTGAEPAEAASDAVHASSERAGDAAAVPMAEPTPLPEEDNALVKWMRERRRK